MGIPTVCTALLACSSTSESTEKRTGNAPTGTAEGQRAVEAGQNSTARGDPAIIVTVTYMAYFRPSLQSTPDEVIWFQGKTAFV